MRPRTTNVGDERLDEETAEEVVRLARAGLTVRQTYRHLQLRSCALYAQVAAIYREQFANGHRVGQDAYHARRRQARQRRISVWRERAAELHSQGLGFSLIQAALVQEGVRIRPSDLRGLYQEMGWQRTRGRYSPAKLKFWQRLHATGW